MDRNNPVVPAKNGDIASLSARRAWIEMTTYLETSSIDDVALRKESVDRNESKSTYYSPPPSRSPQGERG